MGARKRPCRKRAPGRRLRLHRKRITTMKKLILLLFIAAVAASCRPTRKIGAALAKKDSAQAAAHKTTGHDDSVAYIRDAMATVRSHHIDFNTFSAKVNIDYKDADNKNYNVNATLRMQKDSAIWISANAFMGIEAIRALITKDSVKVMVKLDKKTYTARSMSYLQEVTDMPLTLSTMQDLIIGNPIFLDSAMAYSRTPGTVTLLSVGDLFKHLLALNEGDLTIARSKIDDINPASSRTADITYSDYADKDGMKFATKRQIILSEVKKL
ncbi:MAG: DUF4292 domain-containing protein, partial [Chitinophagaceae bacterium]